ncbi:hypothetical protein GCM10027048_09300 [Hymenobacter coalescens]
MSPFLSLYAAWPTRRKILAALLLIGPVAYFALFYRLGSRPIAMWDESRLATNAVEMLRNGNWLVTHFADAPDLWNTKPPLLIWLQAGLMKILGPTTLAIRLPSALAALGTTALLAWFCNRVLNSPLLGLCSALVLLTTSGYIDWHVTRSGDYDSLLVLLTTWYTLSFFRYLEEGRRGLLWQAGIGVALAVLTKGVAGALALPALLLYAVFSRRLLFLVRQPVAYAVLATTLGIIAAFYVGRELAAPGYWHAVYENELGGRLLGDLTFDGDVKPWSWYIDQLVSDELLPWVYLLPVGLVALLYPGVPPLYRRFALLVSLFIVSFLAVISSAETKYFWYEAPIYPFCALLAGAGLALILEAVVLRVSGAAGEQRLWPQVLLVVLLLAALASPFSFIMAESDQLYATRHDETDIQFGRYLERQAENFGQLDKYYLLSGLDYNATTVFYRSAAALEYGHTVDTRYSWHLKEFRPNDVVVVCNPAMRAKLDSTYVMMPLYEESPCATLLIKTAK